MSYTRTIYHGMRVQTSPHRSSTVMIFHQWHARSVTASNRRICLTPWQRTYRRIPRPAPLKISSYQVRSPTTQWHTPSGVAMIFAPPLANNLFGPLAKGLRRLLLPGGPLAPLQSRGPPPRGRGACGALATPLHTPPE